MRILRAVETVFDVTADQLRGRNKTDRFAAARAAVAWCGRRMGISTARLARAIRKDTSTVTKTSARAERRRSSDPHFARCCDEVLRRAGEADGR